MNTLSQTVFSDRKLPFETASNPMQQDVKDAFVLGSFGGFGLQTSLNPSPNRLIEGLQSPQHPFRPLEAGCRSRVTRLEGLISRCVRMLGSRKQAQRMILAGSIPAARRAGMSAASTVVTSDARLTQTKSQARISGESAVMKYKLPGITNGCSLK